MNMMTPEQRYKAAYLFGLDGHEIGEAGWDVLDIGPLKGALLIPYKKGRVEFKRGIVEMMADLLP